ncbi:hypothetical protein FRC17_009378 [Serendipita sp. 399]|nr:hypothetical protein FRC17_009378 [Serendipita sp. 399]
MYAPWAISVLPLLACFPGSPLFVVAARGDMVFTVPQVRLTTTFADFKARIMDHWGGGGGHWAKISKDSKHPFEGRDFGGGKRYEIRGTKAFGSGYPYGAGNLSTVARRPFPFGVWPLYWDQNFMDADEYGPQYDAIRPGGFIASIPLRTTSEHFNVTADEVYYAIGDRESLLPLMVSYVTWCHVTPAWPTRFNASAADTTIKLENVIQYFRASSFALASPAYNNTFARIGDSGSKESTPLPEFMEYSPFRKCVDHVAENALAIVNKIPSSTPLQRFVSALAGAGVFICGIMLFLLLNGLLLLAEVRAKFQKWIYGDRNIPRRVQDERRQELQYENYP